MSFSNPTAPKKEKPREEKVNSHTKNICYDERSSDFVQAGTNYGQGFRVPVGHTSNPKSKVDALPYGCKAVNIEAE